MGYADLHIHTTYSWDATSSVQELLEHTAYHTLLDVIAITDHDQIDGALEAYELAPEYNIEVIPGIEVSSNEGHILALYITRSIPAGLSLEETVFRIVDQNGLCIIPHPMINSRLGISPISIKRALQNPRVAAGLVGIEMFNAGLAGAQRDSKAVSLAEWLPLSRVGSSDAHDKSAISMGATQFPGHSAADLRRALLFRQTQVIGLHRLNWYSFTIQYLPRLFLRYASSFTKNVGRLRPQLLSKSLTDANQIILLDGSLNSQGRRLS